MRKNFLEKRLARLESKKKSLVERCNASEDVKEVRNLTEQVEELNADIAETKEELELLAKEEEARSANPVSPVIPSNAKLVNHFDAKDTRSEEAADKYATKEYRAAFMNYVVRGISLPGEYRNGDTTTTADSAAVIPTTIMREVINTVRKRYGNLYNKVRKLSVKGGVEFPIGSLSASFKWVSETTVSPRQKLGTTAKISFGYHTAEIRISQTFVSQITAIDEFESKISEVIAIAYLKAMDDGIVNGTGNGQMLGILNDARVTNSIDMTAADFADWKKWRKNFFAKLPLGYRAGEFIFPLSTVETYLETMSDDNNNPIFRQATGLEVNDGDAVNPNGRFFGREVSLVEPEIIPDFDTANVGDVVGIYWQPNEYAINENFAFTMRKYFDEETNEFVNKALVVVDGKALNTTGFYLIKKKNA